MSEELAELEAILGKPNPAENERWELLRRSGNGECCGKCGEDFLKGEPVYRKRGNIGRGFLGGSRTVILSYCDSCAPKDLFAQNPTGKCKTCERTVHYPWDLVDRRHIFCSERCRKAHYTRVQRDKRLANRQKTCVCGKKFVGARSDSKYCSAACKQRTYRASVRAA